MTEPATMEERWAVDEALLVEFPTDLDDEIRVEGDR